ncbi:MAG: Fic family protein [Planctomycetota bacterium]
MALRESDNEELYARVQEKNLLRQYDLLTNCIEIGLENGIDCFDKYVLWALNSAAVANIAQFGGRFREQPIYVGNHIPPHFEKVPGLVDQCISVVHENWDAMDYPTLLPAYVLWRLNWIHPFIEGNGRTARAACYYLICMRCGSLLPGKKTVPERIRENRPEYVEALRDADRHWANGQFNVDRLADYLAKLLQDQLSES